MGKKILIACGSLLLFFTLSDQASAAELMDTVSDTLSSTTGANSDTIQLFVVLTLLSFGTAFLVLTTSFTRIIIVLSFTRSSLGTQQNPPNMVLTGLAVFLTFFVMKPVYTEVMEEAVNPYLNHDISLEEAIDVGEDPIKEFMSRQTRDKDIRLFLDISGEKNQLI